MTRTKIRSASPKKAKTAGAVKRKKAVKPTTVLDVLRAARKLLTPRRAWTKGENARDASGERVLSMSPSATCWCAEGAIQRAANDDCVLTHPSYRLLKTAASSSTAFEYNDAPRRTHKQILSWFDRAIKLAKAGA